MANSWWEIQVYADPALEDLIFWRLETFGCRGTSSQNGQILPSGQVSDGQVSNLPQQGQSRLIQGYLPRQQVRPSNLATLAVLLRQDAAGMGLIGPAVRWNLINEEDWSNSWKQYWQPQEIGDRFLIYPAWLAIPPSDRLVLRLDPGVAFGTGTHATTQLCLESMEQLSKGFTNAIVVDIGCGSGILSIGAVLLGVSKVYAVDLDPLAVQSARSNRDLNQIDPQRLVVEQGGIERFTRDNSRIALTDQPVDGILCNILADVIIDLVPQMSAIAKPTTWGILSGILGDQAGQVTDTLEQHGWVVLSIWHRQDWCCINTRRSD